MLPACASSTMDRTIKSAVPRARPLRRICSTTPILSAYSPRGSSYNKKMSLVVVGSVAYDGVETPHGRVDRMLGGAATYISLASSFFTKTRIVAVVGEDFEEEDTALLASRGIDLTGVERVAGKTFFWAGKYSD